VVPSDWRHKNVLLVPCSDEPKPSGVWDARTVQVTLCSTAARATRLPAQPVKDLAGDFVALLMAVELDEYFSAVRGVVHVGE
jgi:hypothetical protein